MKHTIALFAAFSLLGAVALAAPPTSDKKPVAKKPVVKTAKIVDVWTCPIQKEKIADHKTEAGKPEVVGNYRVHFCCAGCDTTFAKLSEKDKKAKAEAAHKIDIAKSETPTKKG